MDIQSNLIINELIRELKGKGKTLIIASHIFATLRDLCDEIHLLKNGEILEKVMPEGYRDLEDRMRSVSIGNRIKLMGLK